MSAQESKILNASQINQKIIRIAHQVAESFIGEEKILVVGIANRGYRMAELITANIKMISKTKVELHELKMDKRAPLSGDIELDADLDILEGCCVLVVDDVVNSGRTLMHACRHLLQAPVKRLNTAVLVDREHRKFPIKSDFVGLTLSTTLQEHIEVKLAGKQSSVHLN